MTYGSAVVVSDGKCFLCLAQYMLDISKLCIINIRCVKYTYIDPCLCVYIISHTNVAVKCHNRPADGMDRFRKYVQ